MPDPNIKDVKQSLEDTANKANQAVAAGVKIAQPKISENALMIAALVGVGLFGRKASSKPLESRPALEEKKEDAAVENKQPNDQAKP
jgi:hypothetical protein